MIYFNHDIQVLSWWCNSRIIFRSLVWLNQYTQFSSCPLLLSWIAPDGSNRFSFYRQCSRSSLLMKCKRLHLNHWPTNWFFIIGFNFSPLFCRFLSIGCATALSMGVAPEAIAEFFGYRLKKIVIPVPYTISCDIFWDDSHWIILFFFSYDVSPRVQDEVCSTSWQILSLSFPLFVRTFYFDTLIPLFYQLWAEYKIPLIYFGPNLCRGPLACNYK
jgi:hypothetical protein